MMSLRLGTFVGICLLLASDSLSPGESLGDVHFSTSCRAETQNTFDSGMALLHSFEFGEAETAFHQVEMKDPSCVIAAWGVALSNTERSGADAPKKNLAKGWAELQPWLTVKAKTDREQMYLDAVRAMYQDYDKLSGSQRWGKYLKLMRKLSDKYPDDVNALLLYGLGLVWTAGPGKQGLDQRRTALAIFFPVFKKHPTNPGAAHYIIHAADTSELAIEALPAARKYAAIAPDSPHALHMPSHIFNRLGLWQDSIDTNEASARVAREWTERGREGSGDEFHALNNIEYATLQLGEDQKASEVAERIATLAQSGNDRWLAIDARIYFDLETHNWKDALLIQPPPRSSFEENFDVYWIRTIAAARSGDSTQARAELENYQRSETEWNKSHGWEDVLGIGLAEAEAWTRFSENRKSEAVACLRKMASYERDHPMYYADILPRPTGEMLGDMLLQMNRPADALLAYKASLIIAPNRFDSLTGASRAAELAGMPTIAEGYRTQVKNEGGRLSPRP